MSNESLKPKLHFWQLLLMGVVVCVAGLLGLILVVRYGAITVPPIKSPISLPTMPPNQGSAPSRDGLPKNQSDASKREYCKAPRPEICSMECIDPPPYLCGSNGRSYCSGCQACADPAVEWYTVQNEACSVSY